MRRKSSAAVDRLDPSELITRVTAQPPGSTHATIQLDYFPDGGSPQPSELHVAWMRQYR